MSGQAKRALHPLLLDRGYWSRRLRALRTSLPGLVLIPRPDLSTAGVEVEEFRVRAHDGLRLWGLRARNRFGASSARVRVVGPSDLPQVDRRAVQDGVVELILQEPAGRLLQDRVLDVLRVVDLARESGLAVDRIELAPEDGAGAPDELLIASQLLEGEASDLRLDETAGWPVLPDRPVR